MRIVLAASAGGHLRQLQILEPWWRAHERHWVTFDKADAVSMLAEEHTSWAFHPTTRNVPNLIRNFGVAWRVLRAFRPDVVVSTGAAIAVPFFVLAKLFGVRTVFLEVYDRIDSPTLTGRLCRPLADLFLVQWPEQQRLYKGSTLVGQLL